MKLRNSRFQTFAVIWILYIFFWVFPRRQIVVGQGFGTPCQFHLQRLDVDCLHPAFEDGTDTGFRNVGQLQFDAGEIPKRIYTSSEMFSRIMRTCFVPNWTKSAQTPVEYHLCSQVQHDFRLIDFHETLYCPTEFRGEHLYWISLSSAKKHGKYWQKFI